MAHSKVRPNFIDREKMTIRVECPHAEAGVAIPDAIGELCSGIIRPFSAFQFKPKDKELLITLQRATDFEMLINLGKIKYIIGTTELEARISPLGDKKKKVLVKGIPLQFGDDEVLNLFKNFGENITIDHSVTSRSNEKVSKFFRGIWNGDRFLNMDVIKNIPTVMIFKNEKITVMYEGQVETCFYCKSEGHKIQECAKLCELCKNRGHNAKTCPHRQFCANCEDFTNHPEVECLEPCLECCSEEHTISKCPRKLYGGKHTPLIPEDLRKFVQIENLPPDSISNSPQ